MAASQRGQLAFLLSKRMLIFLIGSISRGLRMETNALRRWISLTLWLKWSWLFWMLSTNQWKVIKEGRIMIELRDLVIDFIAKRPVILKSPALGSAYLSANIPSLTFLIPERLSYNNNIMQVFGQPVSKVNLLSSLWNIISLNHIYVNTTLHAIKGWRVDHVLRSHFHITFQDRIVDTLVWLK